MNLSITGRHLEITAALRNHVKNKINKADKYSYKIIETSVILGVEKYRHTAEINMRINGATLSAKEETEDMYTSFDRALDKIERQLLKYKDRYSNKIHHMAKVARKKGANYPDKESAWDEDEPYIEVTSEPTSPDEVVASADENFTI